MLKDIRRLVAFVYILQATVIELFERLAQLRFGVALDAALAIDLLVVLALSAADSSNRSSLISMRGLP